MTCSACAAKVQKGLSAVPGVIHAQVDLKSKKATVLVEIPRFDEKALLSAVEKAGYQGKMLK
ncbi:MAG: heavy-metal-associated domain-containing protein [Gemmataceae bacterium]|nr:heavy-metal-associated domain-containing protein [Gemmataceae bacterium]